LNLLFRKLVNKYYQVPAMGMILSLLGGYEALGQSSNSFTSLQQPSFAKIAALGGVNASLYRGGNSFYLYNPALLSEEGNGHLALSYALLPGGTGLSNINYNFRISEVGSFGAGLQYLSYGSIQGYDLTGAPTEVFTPNDFTFSISHARQVNNFRLGATIKFANTSISGYNGNAILFDMGGVFIHPTKDFTVAMAIKNFGFVTSEFYSASNTTLPFDVQIGASVKPQHMPIRFSVTLQQLQQWNLMNEDEEINSLNTSLDNFFRHVVLAAEIILNEHVSILTGYNHLRRKDLRLEQSGGFSGFSLGTEISVKAFQLVYAFGGYHVSGNTSTFTLATNLDQITTKKQVK
jgi:hypothetical protein